MTIEDTKVRTEDKVDYTKQCAIVLKNTRIVLRDQYGKVIEELPPFPALRVIDEIITQPIPSRKTE